MAKAPGCGYAREDKDVDVQLLLFELLSMSSEHFGESHSTKETTAGHTHTKTERCFVHTNDSARDSSSLAR